MSIATQGPTTLSVEIAGREITFETGKLAKQADGAVLVREGDTMVLATAQGRTEAREGADFFPLTVDVEERMYAAGKIPGGFFKREGRPTERAILTARMIDRPIRPLWPKGFKNEVHVVATTLSADLISAHDILAINGASAALMISPLPFMGPVGAVRMGLIDGELVVNPTLAEVEQGDSTLDLIVVGTKDALTMVEAGASEIPEELLLEALEQAHDEIRKLCELQEDLQRQVGKAKWVDNELTEELEREHGDRIRQRIQSEGLREGGAAVEEIVEEICPPLTKDSITRQYVKKASEAIYKELARRKIAVEKRRPDGRGSEDIREITCEVGVAPRPHGSALFTRGQTQIMTLLTLGTAKEGQRIDDLSLETDRRYMHHYNFPPYSVGETGFMRGPKRRDIGHGALAQRALEPMIPSAEEFPYTIRLVSETLESNGSSSMGSVCGSTLALMDAGVPIKRPVSGIAMGLVKEGDDYVILTDIQGAEDHLGDMDFKVAGSRDGVTALQMDIKITGVTQEIMRGALEQAKRAREFILDRMLQAIPEPRTELSENAPRISTVKIDPEKIGMVIGKGGETIRALEGDYDVQIDIEEDGTILIYAVDGPKAQAAITAIETLTKEPEVGDEFRNAKVVKTTQFGAFVELKKGTDGLLHVSNVGPGRVGHIEDVINRGDILDVLAQEVDKARGRIGLKLIQKHENGNTVSPEELIERAKDAPPRERTEERPREGDRRGGRGGRGGRRGGRDRERS